MNSSTPIVPEKRLRTHGERMQQYTDLARFRCGAKFVTSPAYAPRLRRRRRIEQELVEDAHQHGWQREVERHQCTIQRIERLLTDLGEPILFQGIRPFDVFACLT